MKRQSLVLLAVAIVAAGAAACFKNPLSDLRNGPAYLSTSFTNIILKAGDSVVVTAYLKDDGGNVLPETDATWTSGDPTVAVARKDSALSAPGDAFTRGFIRGVVADGGWTNVIVASRGVADTIRVVVVPAKLTAQHVAFNGPTLDDSVIKPADPLVPGDTTKHIAYTAPDTLILNGTSLFTFDTSQVTVSVGTYNGESNGLIVAKSPSQLKVIFQVGTAGKLMVQHMELTPGNAAVGTIALDTVIGDSIAVAPWRIGPAAFGASAAVASNILTVTAGTNMTFSAATTASLGSAAGIIIGQTATSLSMFSPVNYNGSVTLYHVALAADPTVGGSVTFDSIASSVGPLGAMTPAVFPNANIAMSPNNARLGDTVILTAPGGLAFGTSPVSKVILGNTAISTSDTAWNVSVAAGTMKVLAKRGGTSNVTVTNMQLATGGPPFSLTTPNPVAIDSVAFDFASYPTEGGAGAVTITAPGVDTVYGAVNVGSAPQDFWTFTTTATQTIKGTLGWFGTGNPGYGGANNSDTQHTADLDLLLCNTGLACDESVADLFGYGGASAGQPESGTAAAMPAAQYWMAAIAFTAASESIVYRLIITLQ